MEMFDGTSPPVVWFGSGVSAAHAASTGLLLLRRLQWQRGIEETPSQVRAFLVHAEDATTAHQALREHVSFDAKLYSDEHGAYRGIRKTGRRHEIVVHSKGEYVRGRCHTNSVENFWSLFKRGVIGSYHFVSVKHLQRYLDEFQFRFNNREAEDLFGMVITNLAFGTALRYKNLTAPRPALPRE